MKPFFLFAGHQYYPGGGWLDFHSAHGTVSDALIALAESSQTYDWFHVVDIRMGEIVKQGEKP
jgi:hypothetical protein